MSIIRKYRRYHKLSVLAGVLLAILIVTTQASVYYINDGVPVAYQVDDSEEEGTAAPQYITKDAIAVSSIQLNIDKPFQVVFELLQSDDEAESSKPDAVSFCLEFFKNLFRLTISPNAP